MRTQDIEYHADGARLVGYFAVDDTKPGKRPGVIVGPEGNGLSEHTKNSARRLAEAGFAAFAFDYYGDGKPIEVAEVMPRAAKWLEDPTGIRLRAHAGLEVLMRQPETDAARLAAIGYCFGGTAALEMARCGEPILAAVGFHSTLTTARPAKAGEVKAKLLVQIGALDPFIPAEQREAFEQEMTEAGADWRLTVFGGVVHSYTNPNSPIAGLPGIAYDASADRRSWRAMLDLFDEVF